jgi:hypothetical protein
VPQGVFPVVLESAVVDRLGDPDASTGVDVDVERIVEERALGPDGNFEIFREEELLRWNCFLRVGGQGEDTGEKQRLDSDRTVGEHEIEEDWPPIAADSG